MGQLALFWSTIGLWIIAGFQFTTLLGMHWFCQISSTGVGIAGITSYDVSLWGVTIKVVNPWEETLKGKTLRAGHTADSKGVKLYDWIDKHMKTASKAVDKHLMPKTALKAVGSLEGVFHATPLLMGHARQDPNDAQVVRAWVPWVRMAAASDATASIEALLGPFFGSMAGPGQAMLLFFNMVFLLLTVLTFIGIAITAGAYLWYYRTYKASRTVRKMGTLYAILACGLQVGIFVLAYAVGIWTQHGHGILNGLTWGLLKQQSHMIPSFGVYVSLVNMAFAIAILFHANQWKLRDAERARQERKAQMAYDEYVDDQVQLFGEESVLGSEITYEGNSDDDSPYHNPNAKIKSYRRAASTTNSKTGSRFSHHSQRHRFSRQDGRDFSSDYSDTSSSQEWTDSDASDSSSELSEHSSDSSDIRSSIGGRNGGRSGASAFGTINLAGGDNSGIAQRNTRATRGPRLSDKEIDALESGRASEMTE